MSDIQTIDGTFSTFIQTINCSECYVMSATMTYVPFNLKSGSLVELHHSLCFTCSCKPPKD